MSNITPKPPTLDEATNPTTAEPSAEVIAWRDAKVRAAIEAADAGEFATPEDVRAVIQKYVPNG